MRRVLLSASLFLIPCLLFSQNIGIGISNPSYNLHVGNGTMRIEGPSSPGGTALSMGGYGVLSIDAPGTAGGRFAVFEDGNTYIGGNLGIRSVANFPLNFSTDLGDKISLWGFQGAHYGFGIQSNLLQVHTDLPSSDIAFGYGSSSLMVETMRIKGNGNVGIGTSVPGFKLDVAGRMRIQSGGGTAGLYLNNSDNSQTVGFVGMHDDTHLGFWGNVAQWAFTMNTQTGALKINGSEGVNGQVITSSGGGAAQWRSPTNSLYNNTIQYTSSALVEITLNSAWTPLPGLTTTFTIPGNAKVFCSFSVEVSTGSCFNCGATSSQIGVFLDGTLERSFLQDVANGSFANISGHVVESIGPGTHTIELRGLKIGPAAFFASGAAFNRSNVLILQVIQQ